MVTRHTPTPELSTPPEEPGQGTGEAGRSSWTSRELFGPRTEIGIEHGGALYRLKITRQGKLILNK
ncbi:hemin uptake protein HemP [Pararhizobium mangrovi]|uniref:hemin uptake protein HemP n=1 Tax=Pararhizobium mangrovi TaxID=2590452 RepID=UPI0038B2CE1F